MGAQVSIAENVAESVTDIVNKVVMENNSNCGGESIINQGISADKVGGDVVIDGMTLDASQDINLECLQRSDNNLDISNKIQEELEQMAKSKLSGLNFGLGASMTSNLMRSITKLSSEIKVDNVKNCLYRNIIDQSARFGEIENNLIVRNFNAKAVQTSVASCIQEDNNTLKAINDFKKSLQQTADSSIEGLLAGPMGSIIIGIIAIVALFFVYKFFLAKSGGSTAPPMWSAAPSFVSQGNVQQVAAPFENLPAYESPSVSPIVENITSDIVSTVAEQGVSAAADVIEKLAEVSPELAQETIQSLTDNVPVEATKIVEDIVKESPQLAVKILKSKPSLKPVVQPAMRFGQPKEYLYVPRK